MTVLSLLAAWSRRAVHHPAVLWRLPSLSSRAASHRYRCFYPAFFLHERHAVDSVIMTGALSARRLERLYPSLSTAVFVRSFGADDLALATALTARGIRTVYDQTDNIFAKSDAAAREELDCLRQALPVISQFTFASPALRDLFVANGFPPEKCCSIDDMMIDFAAEQRALAWAATRMRRQRPWPLGDRTPRRVPPPPSAPPLPVRTEQRVLVWFGAAGSRHGEAGLDLLRPLLPCLNKVHGDVDFELVLVTSSREACDTAMDGAAFPWTFVPWSLDRCAAQIRVADAAIIPTGEDSFNRTKSANRALYAIAHGIPVITNAHPGHAGLEPALHMVQKPEAWEPVIRRVLSRRDADWPAQARQIADRGFGPDGLARRWRDALIGSADGQPLAGA